MDNMADEVPASALPDDKKNYQFEDQSQLDLYERLLEVAGLGPASAFKDVCRMMTLNPPLEHTSHLVAHMLRELESALRDICLGPIESSAEASKQNWISKLFNWMREKIKKYSGGEEDGKHRAEIRLILRSYGWDKDGPIGKFWLSLLKPKRRLHKRAHRNALGKPKPIDDELRRIWKEFQDFLRILLTELEHRYSLFVKQLTEILKHAEPSKEDLKLLKSTIPNSPVLMRYFFENLSHPKWVVPLRKAGFFDDPPGIESNGNANYWPALKYLARVAKEEEVSEEVAQILESVSETKNILVVRDILIAATALPASKAARLAKYVEQWISLPNNLIHHRLPDFLKHIAKGGCAEEALELTKLVIRVAPQTKEQAELKRDPQAVIEMYSFDAVIDSAMPEVINTVGIPAFEILCGALAEGLGQMMQKYEKAEPYTDHSKIWRHHIAGEERHFTREFCNNLMTGVRDAGVSLVNKDPANIEPVIDVLMKRKWTAHRRIALFILSQLSNPPRDLVAKFLGDEALLGDDGIRREYDLLANVHAKLLTQAEVEALLKSTDTGPDVEAKKKRHREFWGAELTDDEVVEYVEEWKLDRLFPFRSVLQGALKTECERLITKYGEPEDEEPPCFATRTGERTPLTRDELKALSLEKLIEHLRTWQPSGEWDDPTPRGLGGELAALVVEDPEYYAKHAMEFRGLEATYVRSLLDGFQKALKKKSFDWTNVLGLCSWAIDQGHEIPGRDPRSFDIDPSWNWCRMQIARLIEDGIREHDKQIPVSLRKEVWEIIEKLAEDPDPKPDHEKLESGEFDPRHIAINSVRGQSIENVILYALWLFRGLNIDETARAAGSFNQMSEVKQILDRHLNPEIDPSLAVRSVYGLYFPSLHYLDRSWARGSADKIFPTDPSQKNLRDAAWFSYILNRVFGTVFEGLKTQYASAVGLIGTTSNINPRQLREPDEHLAGHLMALYISGDIALDSSDGLLPRFLESASDELRGVAIGCIGQMFERDSEPKSEELKLAMDLWNHRLDIAKKSPDPKAFSKEMMSFGWWIISGKFEEKWSLEQLKEALTIAEDIEMDHQVAQKLAELTDRHPLLCVECLEMIANGKDSAEWGLHGYMKEAQEIIRKALSSGDDAARKKADELRNSFILRGFISEFENL